MGKEFWIGELHLFVAVAALNTGYGSPALISSGIDAWGAVNFVTNHVANQPICNRFDQISSVGRRQSRTDLLVSWSPGVIRKNNSIL